jgi:hypothetical protein
MNGRIAYESYLKKRWKVAEVDYEIDGGEIKRHGWCHGIAGHPPSKNPFPEKHWAWETWLDGWENGSLTYRRKRSFPYEPKEPRK